MKEELQGKLVEILTSIQGAVGKAGDIAAAELPDIAQSYIVFGKASSTAVVVGSFVWSVFAIWGFMRFSYHERMYWATRGAEEGEHRHKKGLFGLLAASGAVPLIMFIASVQSFFLVWFAPKVWLLKEIAGMLK